MAEFTLHLEASADTDLDAVTAELQKQLASVKDVEVVRAAPQRFQGIDAQEIISVIKVSTEIAKNGAALLTTLAALWAAFDKLRARFPGLKAPKVEKGLRQIPAQELTAEDAVKIANES